jgi:hypothetical protein
MEKTNENDLEKDPELKKVEKLVQEGRISKDVAKLIYSLPGIKVHLPGSTFILKKD